MLSPSAVSSGGTNVATWTYLKWEATPPEPFASEQTIVADAIAVGEGFIAVGTTSDGGTAAGRVWRSDDGRAWERIDDPGIEAMLPQRVLLVGETLVVLGLEPATADGLKNLDVWESSDGRTWVRGPALPVPADPTSAAGGQAGILLAVGRDTWLLDPNLASWTRTATWPADVYLGRPAWANGQWLQPGATGVVGANAPTTATVWTSTDGSTWEAGSMTPPGGAVFDVYAAQDGFVAVGQHANLCLLCRGPIIQPSAEWASADGRTWEAIPSQPGLPRGGDRFASDGQRIVQVGPVVAATAADPGGALLAETLDGASWNVIVQSGSIPVAIGGGGVIAVGPRGVAVLPGNTIDMSGGPYRPAPWWGAATPGVIAPRASVDPSAGATLGIRDLVVR